MSDFKSLKELDAAFDDILKETDPNTIKGKWERAKKKIANSSKSWLVQGVAVATGVLTLYVLVRTCGPKIAKFIDDHRKIKNEFRQKRDQVVHDLYADGVVDDSVGVWRMKLAIWREMHNIHEKAVKEHAKTIEKMMNSIAAFLDKFASNDEARKNFHGRAHADVEAYQTAVNNQNQRDANREKVIASARTAGQLAAQNQFENDHLPDKINREAQLAAARTNAQQQAIRQDKVDNQTIYDNLSRSTSRNQELGKQDAYNADYIYNVASQNRQAQIDTDTANNVAYHNKVAQINAENNTPRTNRNNNGNNNRNNGRGRH